MNKKRDPETTDRKPVKNGGGRQGRSFAQTTAPSGPGDSSGSSDHGVFDTDLSFKVPFHPPNMQLGRVEYTTPDGRVHSAPLGERTSVGRHTDNDIQLLDPEVSKTHLVIERTADGFRLFDLGSANGTLLREEPVEQARLKDGDEIHIGNSFLKVFIDEKTPIAEETMRNPDDVGGAESGKHVPPGDSPFDDRPPTMPAYDADRTMVTLVPGSLGTQDAGHSSVFALPMSDPFVSLEDFDIDVGNPKATELERLKVAFEFAGKVGIVKDLASLGAQILERVVELLPADTAVIMLRDEDGNLKALSSIAGGEVKIPRAIVERVLETREALLTQDALADVDLRGSHTIVGEHIRAALCVPLLVDKTVYGVIHLSSSSAAGAYEERDLGLLRAIAQPAALAVANARLIERIEREARNRAELERFLSPALVERVVKNDLALSLGGDTVVATVLFADIRGFTAITDRTAPEAVVSLLNEYFEAMVDIVFDCGGVLDKFLGDGLMAVWGTPVRSPTDAARAVEAAQRMREALDEVVNKKRAARGEDPLLAGYGIATGQVIAGAMGGQQRQDFTVIGDTVNLASRLCGEARGGQIIVCDATERAAAAQAQVGFRRLPPMNVKGVSRAVAAFEVMRT